MRRVTSPSHRAFAEGRSDGDRVFSGEDLTGSPGISEPAGRPRKPRCIPDAGGLRAISRAAMVLRALGAHRSGLTLSELADVTALPMSTCHRLVAALDQEGLVLAQPRGRIFLGPAMTQHSVAGQTLLAPEIRHAMQMLSSQLDETVDVAVLDGHAICFIAQSRAGERLRPVSSVGVRFPLHCTGSGKAFLASMGRSRAAALLPTRLPRLTAHSVTSRRALWRELADVQSTGVGFDREEHHLGIASLATLIPDSHGRTVAMSVVVPAVRFCGRESDLAAALLSTSALARQHATSARRNSAPV